jgi:tetratricopeptide (TPR) repeat protein
MFDFNGDALKRTLRNALGHSVDRDINRLINEAHSLIGCHRPREAMVSARSALALAEQHEVIMPPGTMLHLGYALSDLHDNDAALDCYQVARDRFVVEGDAAGIAHVDMNVAIVLTQLDRHDEAVELLEEASAVFAKYGATDDLDACRVNLTSALRGAGRLVEAVEVGRQAVEAVRQAGDALRLPDALSNMANAELGHGNREAARVAYIEALDLFRKLGLPTEEADCLDGLGVIARQDGLFDFAASMHAKAIAMYAGRDHDVDQAVARYNLAITELWRRNYGAALREALLASTAPVTVVDPAMVAAAALDGLGRRGEAAVSRAGFAERQGADGVEREASSLP